MLRVANLTVRALVVTVAGVITFAAGWPGAVDGTVEIVAFSLATVLLVLWIPADRMGPARRGRRAVLMPYALGTVLVACGLASAVPTGGTLIVLGVVAAVTAASDTSLVAGGVVVGLGVLSAGSAALLYGSGVSATFGGPVVLFLGFVLGHNLRAHRVQTEQANRLREQEATMAALDERARIAREIHDVLAHSLGALGLQIQVARAVLTDQRDEARTVELLGQAQRMAADGLKETRRAVHALRGETVPLPDGLTELGASHQRQHGVPVTVGIHGEPRPLSPDAGLAITRTAQEALVNTAKHAPRQAVEIRLDYEDAGTSLTVTNPLSRDGDDEEPRLATLNGRYGLAGMRERLLLLDGTLSAGRQDGTWVVVAKVPQ